MRKFLRITAKCIIAVLILILAFVVYVVSNWQFRYAYTHSDEYFNTFITIMGEKYYFDASPILHSEKEFRKISTGITYEELVEKFGRENGQLNSNGLKNGIYYALAEDRFVVFKLTGFPPENGKTDRDKNVKSRIVWRVFICDDKELLEVLAEDEELYEACAEAWNLYLDLRYGDGNSED